MTRFEEKGKMEEAKGDAIDAAIKNGFNESITRKENS